MGSATLNAYTAVIDATAGATPGAAEPPAFARIAGVPLLSRSLEACRSAGLRKVLVTIDGAFLDEARRLGRRLAPRLLVEVVPATHPDPWLAVRSGLNRAALILPGDRLIQPELLTRMQEAPLPEGGATLAIARGEDPLLAGPEATGVRVQRGRVVALAVEPVASNGRATGVWLATAGLLDEVAAARVEGREAPLALVLEAAAAGGRLSFVGTGPEPAPLRVPSAERAHEIEATLLEAAPGEPRGRGPLAHLTRWLLQRGVLRLGLSRLTVALAAVGLTLAGSLAIVLAGWRDGWTSWLSWPGALLVLAGALVARAERRLTQLHARPPLGGPWIDALRADLTGLAFFGALGLHLSLSATSADAAAPVVGFSRTASVYLVLTALLIVLTAYARYVIYFDTFRRLGGLHARDRFTWWFDEPGKAPGPWRSALARTLRGATWGWLLALGAAGVLVDLRHLTFLVAVAGAAGLFVLALLHQIQRGDL